MTDKKQMAFDHMPASLIRKLSEHPSKGAHLPSQPLRVPESTSQNQQQQPPANPNPRGGENKK